MHTLKTGINSCYKIIMACISIIISCILIVGCTGQNDTINVIKDNTVTDTLMNTDEYDEKEETTAGSETEETERKPIANETTEKDSNSRKNELGILKSSLKEYISGFSGTYGIYYINLKTGNEFGINDTQEYIAASTSKLPINLYLYRNIEKGIIDPEQILTYEEEDYEPGTGNIQNEPFGTEYTVRETSRLSIVLSDNCAINMIIRLLGVENIRQYMLDIGGSIYYGNRHRTCPRDMAYYMRELYNFYVENPSVAGELIDCLKNTVFNDRINALLPENIPVAHKIGNQTNTMNDVGIIFADEPYILSVFSDNVSTNEACNVIANISKKIFDFIEKNKE